MAKAPRNQAEDRAETDAERIERENNERVAREKAEADRAEQERITREQQEREAAARQAGQADPPGNNTGQREGGDQDTDFSRTGGPGDQHDDGAGDGAKGGDINRTEQHAENEADRGTKGDAAPNLPGHGAAVGENSPLTERSRVDGLGITRPNQDLVGTEDHGMLGGFPVIANKPPGSEPLQMDPATGKPHEKQTADEDQERLDKLADAE